MTTTTCPWPLPSTGVRLNLGCQTDLMPGWVNVDRVPWADVTMDLDGAWPWDDESVDFILASHVIEHLRSGVHLLAEAHRVLKPGGVLVVLTQRPHDAFWDDPTHVRPYTATSFRLYTTMRGGYAIHGLPAFSAVEVTETDEEIDGHGVMLQVNARMVK